MNFPKSSSVPLITTPGSSKSWFSNNLPEYKFNIHPHLVWAHSPKIRHSLNPADTKRPQESPQLNNESASLEPPQTSSPPPLPPLPLIHLSAPWKTAGRQDGYGFVQTPRHPPAQQTYPTVPQLPQLFSLSVSLQSSFLSLAPAGLSTELLVLWCSKEALASLLRRSWGEERRGEEDYLLRASAVYLSRAISFSS